MLRLTEQIRRDKRGRRRLIRNDEDFTRSRNHVDRNPAEHLPLGFRDKRITGAYDLVHLRHGLGAVG